MDELVSTKLRYGQKVHVLGQIVHRNISRSKRVLRSTTVEAPANPLLLLESFIESPELGLLKL